MIQNAKIDKYKIFESLGKTEGGGFSGHATVQKTQDYRGTTNNESLLDLYELAINNKLKLTQDGLYWEDMFETDYKVMKAEKKNKLRRDQEEFIMNK